MAAAMSSSGAFYACNLVPSGIGPLATGLSVFWPFGYWPSDIAALWPLAFRLLALRPRSLPSLSAPIPLSLRLLSASRHPWIRVEPWASLF